MTSHERFYKADAYEFPNADLLEYSSAGLRSLISKELPTAQYQIDGLGGITQVHVDYAQDLIEQARDLLLDRGESFTTEEVDALSFLTWPLSEAEQAEHDARLLREAAKRELTYSRLKLVRSRGLEIAREAMQGRLKADSPEVHGVALVIGRSGHSFVDGKITTIGPNGVEVLAVVAQLHALGVNSAKLGGWSCSKVGVTFETDPIPSWSVRMDLPTQAQVWAFLIQWYTDHNIHQTPYIEIDWHDEENPRTDWETLGQLWPTLSKDYSELTEFFSEPTALAFIAPSSSTDISMRKGKPLDRLLNYFKASLESRRGSR